MVEAFSEDGDDSIRPAVGLFGSDLIQYDSVDQKINEHVSRYNRPHRALFQCPSRNVLFKKSYPAPLQPSQIERTSFI